MTTQSPRTAPAGLTADGIVAVAIAVADADGLAAVSMRRVATELGVDPMSLYRHVGTKAGLLEAMTDTVVSGIETAATPSGDWVADARELMLSARRTMLAHPWTAAAIKDRREPTPATLRHLNALLDIMRTGGLDLALTHHALHVLGSRVLGFSDDLFDDGGAPPAPEVAAAQLAYFTRELPRLAELAGAAAHEGGLGGCDDDEEFVFSIDLMLAGLERQRRGTP